PKKGGGEILKVYVLPITCCAPADPADAVELPAVDRHLLGLAERSWVRIDQMNEFTWPGPDIAALPGAGNSRFLGDYGLIRPKTFETIRMAAAARRQARIQRSA